MEETEELPGEGPNGTDPDEATTIRTPATPTRSKSPWAPGGCFEADLDALAADLSQLELAELQRKKGFIGPLPFGWPRSAGGSLGRSLDRWVADELYRAGYEEHSVWPRPIAPAHLPVSVPQAIDRLPTRMRQGTETRRMVREIRASMGARPALIGEFYSKQFDVLVADWDRGVELFVSTKGMTGSFGNNLTNRWEEFVGEVRNIRGRFPIATMGAFFLADSSILKEAGNYARLVDMLRKLRSPQEDRGAFDATALVLAQVVNDQSVVLEMDAVPKDLHPDCFFWRLLLSVFRRMPVTERTAARRMYADAFVAPLQGYPTPGDYGPSEVPCGC